MTKAQKQKLIALRDKHKVPIRVLIRDFRGLTDMQPSGHVRFTNFDDAIHFIDWAYSQPQEDES